jgi:hypothetical protein
MTTAAQHSALRMALRSMLADLSYPRRKKAQPWVEERLGEAAWSETVTDQLRVLALRWAQTQGASVVTALRQSVGETLTDDERAGLPSQARLEKTRQVLTPFNGSETRMIPDMTAPVETEASPLMTPAFEQHLLIVAKEMETPPYWFPDDTNRLARAVTLVEEGHVTVDRFGIYHVQGSKGQLYDIDGQCPCPYGQKAKSKWCAHLVATALHRKVTARVAQDAPSLFPERKTVEERLAGIPPETAQIAPGVANDSLDDLPYPETPTTDPEQKNEVAMVDTTTGNGGATAQATHAPRNDTPHAPTPAPILEAPAGRDTPLSLRLSLPRRSINAIVADLSRPLPQACIATKSQGGQVIPFLHWQTVARMLDTYAPGWHGCVTRVDQVGSACAITYRLTIPCAEGEISREATGQEDEEVKGYGDSTSNAEAMSFKRAAAKFGVGAWLYDKDQTATALANHLKQEKAETLKLLGEALDTAHLDREPVLAWLKTQTGALRTDQIPVAAIRALLAHLQAVA